MKQQFDLAEEPWIPSLAQDASPRTLSLRAVFREAGSIREIQHPSPLVTIALHRLALAVLYRTQKVDSNTAWTKLWRDGFDLGSVEAYLERWRDRFDLFSGKYPFYQRADLEVDASATTPIAKLAPEKAAGNNKQLFDHSADESPESVSPAEAACLLVSVQNWGLGGGKSGGARPNFLHAPLVGGAAVLLKGRNLQETLLLNLVPTNVVCGPARPFAPSRDGDMAAWEREPSPPVEKRPLDGLVDYLTWQARYIRLIRDPDGGVSRCMYVQGDGISSMGSVVDPLHAYRKTNDGRHASISVQRERSAWRDSGSLFNAFGEESEKGSASAVAAYRTLHDRGSVEEKHIPVLVAGMANDKAAVLRWTSDLLNLPAEIIMDSDQVTLLEEETKRAEQVGMLISSSVFAYAARLLFGDEKADADGKVTLSRDEKQRCSALADHLSAETHYWGGLELAFHRFMDSFPETDEWHEAIRRAAMRAFDASIEVAELTGRNLRAQTIARSIFHARLNRELPKRKEESNAA